MTAPIIDAPRLLSQADQVSPKRTPLFLSDGQDGPDLLDAAGAIQPIAEVCAHRDTQTPFMVALVGPSGAGKSFALERLRAAAESAEANPTAGADSAFVTHLLTVPIDAATIAGDPASAIAAAVFAALERGKGGVRYEAAADEAANAGADPHQAARKALERHDEARGKLEAERQARDEVEAKRARLVDNVLFEMAGSRIDAYARASRFQIDARLRRFDLSGGDSVASFKALVRDVSEAGWGGRIGVALRSIWAYRSQRRLLLAAIVLFVLAFAVAQAYSPRITDWLRGLGTAFAPTADWIAGNSSLLGYVTAALIALGALAVIVNLFRAVMFSGMLFRGARLLNHDVGERRRDLDAASARLNRRILALTAEADAAAKRAEAAERRTSARGDALASRATTPAFVEAAFAGPSAARAFLASLAKLMTPERDADPLANFGACRALYPRDPRLQDVRGPIGCRRRSRAGATVPDVRQSRRLAAGAGAEPDRNHAFPARSFLRRGGRLRPRRFGASRRRRRGFATPLRQALPADLQRARPRRVRKRASGRSADRRGAGPSRAKPPARASLSEPLTSAETTLLSALGALAADTPRGVKRYLNAYRVARGDAANRPALALMLALAQSDDKEAVAGMGSLLNAPDGSVEEPDGPPSLVAAVRATRAANGGELTVAEAAAAREVARRYRLFA